MRFVTRTLFKINLMPNSLHFHSLTTPKIRRNASDTLCRRKMSISSQLDEKKVVDEKRGD